MTRLLCHASLLQAALAGSAGAQGYIGESGSCDELSQQGAVTLLRQVAETNCPNWAATGSIVISPPFCLSTFYNETTSPSTSHTVKLLSSP